MSVTESAQVAPRAAQKVYDEHYYRNYHSDSGLPYDRLEVWVNFFSTIAEQIVQRINPRRVLDVGCAKGFLVEALHDRGVDAFGLDISEYAISQVREDIRQRCWVGSAADFSLGSFDLIVCLEVLEHLDEPDGRLAVANLCRHADDILFSSSPDVHPDPTHLNVQPVEYWAEQFAQHGFYRDTELDANFIAPHAVRFRKSTAPFSVVVKSYERKFWRHVEKELADEKRALEQNQHIRAQDSAIQSLRTQLAQAGEVQRQMAESSALLEKDIKQRDQLIESLRLSSKEKDAQIAHRDAEITHLDGELDQVKRSFGFDLLCRFSALRNKWLPTGSRRQALYRFIVSSVKTASREGVGVLFRQARDGLRDKIYSLTPHPATAPRASASAARPEPAWPWGSRVLLVSGSDGNMERYRCHHALEQLRLRGVAASFCRMSDAAFLRMAPMCDVLILHRVPYFRGLDDIVRQRQSNGTPVLLDIDDLVFDEALASRIDALSAMNPAERDLFLDGVRRYRKTLELCDGAIVTTRSLVDAIEKVGKPAWVHRNALSWDMLQISEQAYRNRRRSSDRVIIGYASGTKTHGRDLKEIESSLQRILQEYPQVEFWIVGHLDLPENWRAWDHRIKRVPFVDWRELPNLLAQFDINLAPLEMGNPFCEAKSELKYFEAGIVGVPTVASKTGAFADAIRHGETGMLAENGDGWFEALIKLITDATFRAQLGAQARADVLRRYDPATRGKEFLTTLEQVAARCRKSLDSTNGRPVASRVFKEHALAHEFLHGLIGIEIGAATHNPFGLLTRNVAIPEGYDFYTEHERNDTGIEPPPIHIWASADNLPLPNQSEDFVLTSHVVEHLPNLIDAFVEWDRVVRGGGYVFMIVPLKGALPQDGLRELTSLEHFSDDHERAKSERQSLARAFWQKFYQFDGWLLQQRDAFAASAALVAACQYFRQFIIYGKYAPLALVRRLLPWNPHSVEGVPGGKLGHYHTFTPDSLLEVVDWMRAQRLCHWELASREDVDSKVGNGFTLVFRVRHLLPLA